LKHFGSVVIDETSLVYAVIEPVDTNLAEVVSQRSLAPDEARQLASSMVAALEALHTNGFVHEHLATHTVLAVGETIKLRSDCIRETPEGEEGQWLKQGDVRDLSLVLLEALTQRRSLDEVEAPLPAPFDEIVRRGVTGQWGLGEISIALAADSLPKPLPLTANGSAAHPSVAPVASNVIEMPARVENSQRSLDEQSTQPRRKGVLWMVLAAVFVTAMGLFWRGHEKTSSTSDAVTAGPAPVVTRPTPSSKSESAASPAPVVPAQNDQPEVQPADGEKKVWRVVAFTYNRQDQAQHKADTISQKYPGFGAEVFAPKGKAPYLVTIGGAMTRDDAFALAKRARREGVARDVYAQNYNGRG
jgi:hypothetical protein